MNKPIISICLCSYNDLPYLKHLYDSVIKNTTLPWEFILHDNGSTDGTKEWFSDRINNNLGRYLLKYSSSKENLGVSAVNFAANLAYGQYILDINADMVVLPGWDKALFAKAKKLEAKGINNFLLSLNNIEPQASIESQYIIYNAGQNAQEFDYSKLESFYQSNYNKLVIPDHNQYAHPIFMAKKLWDQMGGVDDQNYGFGQATDHDIPANLYFNCNTRDFIRLGSAHVYHFSNKTLAKLPPVNNDHIFAQKWNLTIPEFRKLINLWMPNKN